MKNPIIEDIVMTLEERKAKIDLLKAKEEYNNNQAIRAKTKPNTPESEALTEAQLRLIAEMQSLDCLINQRPLWN